MLEENINISNILFGYMNVPSFGLFEEDYGGFSIDIYTDGKLIYKTYIFEEIEKTKTEYSLPAKIISAIKKVISDYSEYIYAFNEHTDNGSEDGEGNFFIFAGKRVITWNIDYCNENDFIKNNPEYYKKYIQAIKQENLMLIIFEKISEILKTQGIDLKINGVFFSKKFKK